MSTARLARHASCMQKDTTLTGDGRVSQALFLPEQVRDRLRSVIVRGILCAGSDIGETALCERLGTPRTPLRGAHRILLESVPQEEAAP